MNCSVVKHKAQSMKRIGLRGQDSHPAVVEVKSCSRRKASHGGLQHAVDIGLKNG